MPDFDFTLSDDWGEEIGDVVTNERDAAQILAKRLGISGSEFEMGFQASRGAAVGSDRLRDQYLMLVNLVRMIPEDMRTESVLQTADLRPLLAPIMTTTWQAEQRGNIDVNGQTFTPKMQSLAGSLFIDYRNKVDDQNLAELEQSGLPGDAMAAELARLRDDWRSSPYTLKPTLDLQGVISQDPATGAIVTTGANQQLSDIAAQFAQIANGAGEGGQAPAFLTPDDIRLMFRDNTPASAIGGYMQDLSNRQQAVSQGLIDQVPADELIVEMTGRTGDSGGPYMRPGASVQARNQGRYGAESYTLTQALSLPNGMTEQEVRALSDKMEKAGLYAAVGGTPFIKGDPTDPAFKEAYRRLLAKSVELNRPVSTILQQDALAYEDALSTKTRIRLTDPTAVGQYANMIGQRELGRNLSKQEQRELVSKIHEFERRAGKDETRVSEEGGEMVDVDWQAQIEAMITGQNPEEAAAKDIAANYDTFRSLLGGPVQGVRSVG